MSEGADDQEPIDEDVGEDFPTISSHVPVELTEAPLEIPVEEGVPIDEEEPTSLRKRKNLEEPSAPLSVVEGDSPDKKYLAPSSLPMSAVPRAVEEASKIVINVSTTNPDPEVTTIAPPKRRAFDQRRNADTIRVPRDASQIGAAPKPHRPLAEEETVELASTRREPAMAVASDPPPDGRSLGLLIGGAVFIAVLLGGVVVLVGSDKLPWEPEDVPSSRATATSTVRPSTVAAPPEVAPATPTVRPEPSVEIAPSASASGLVPSASAEPPSTALRPPVPWKKPVQPSNPSDPRAFPTSL